MKYCKDLKKIIKGKVENNRLLSRHTTFKIGGPAKTWIEPSDLKDLIEVIKFARKNKQKFSIIGNGSNLLVRDKGYKGIAIRLSACPFKKIEVNGKKVIVGSGVNLNRLIGFTVNKNLSGCEFLIGIPGTVGGALIGNVGIKQSSKLSNRNIDIGSLVEKVTVLTQSGKVRTIEKKDLKFAYRDSNLSRYIILSAELKLKAKRKIQINKIVKKLNEYKKSTQEFNRPNAGCIFKNPFGENKLSAAKLIDLCGLKGKRIGDACVSEKHANFIINKNKAKASDVLKLMKIIQSSVKKRFKISLKPEIKILGGNQ